jgi:hypothetical protein
MPQRKQQNHAGQPPAPGRVARILISGFLAFNLFAIVAWCVPLESPLLSACRTAVRPYMLWTGLFQKWDMFAPEPSKLNCYVGAQVVFRDGHSALWSFPRMENLGIVDKYFKERYRRYANDSIRRDMNAAAWPDAARRIARLNNSPSNPPVVVNLIRYWSGVPPPTFTGLYAPAPWQQYMFFRYAVAPGDLP